MKETDEVLPGPIDLPRESPRTILFQFVLLPLGVVLIGVLVFLFFGLLASEDHTIRDHVNAIRSGSTHRRWQAAYQLSKSLKRGEAKSYPNLQEEIAAIYRSTGPEERELRRYLTMVLGKIGDKRSTPLLLESLDSDDSETRLYALWALGELQDPRAVPKILELAAEKDRGVRKTAIYALGKIGSRESIPALVLALGDDAGDVRWNAAIALARLNDRSAVPVLREMIDRRRLDSVGRLREDEKAQIMLSAISALSSLGAAEEVRPELERLAAGEPNLTVRSAAKEALP